jgi:hypothetical protein
MEEKIEPIKNLRAALEAFRPPAPEFGESEIDVAAENRDLEIFRKNLQAVSSANRNYFLVCVFFLMVLFGGSCALLLHFIDSPNGVTAIFGATGITFAGLTTQMANLWKKKVTSDMLLVLAGRLQPGDLKGITDVLLREYLK